MIVTVLLLVVAASIAYTVARQAALSASSQGNRLASSASRESLDETFSLVESRLAASPYGFLSTVWPEEPPRVCWHGDGTAETHSASSSWPASCGAAWSYAPPSPDAAVVVRLFGSGSADADGSWALRVQVTTAAGAVTADQVAFYALRGPQKWSWASTGPLNLSSLNPSSTVDVPADGSMYAAGTVTPSPAAGLSPSTSGPYVASGAGFSSQPSSNAFTWFGPSPNLGASPKLLPVSSVQPTPVTQGLLATNALRLGALACPGAAPFNVNANGTAKGTVSSLCLRAGSPQVRYDGSATTVPSSAAAYLLVFSRSHADALEVFASSSAPDLSDGSGLLCSNPSSAPVTCSLPASSMAALNAGTHPGSLGFWSSLGEFRYPASGVISTDATVFVGACGASYSIGAACAPTGSDGGTPPAGTSVKRSVTVLAGTPEAPKDLVVGAPITAARVGDGPFGAGSARVGLVSTGRTVLAYWAHPSGSVPFRLDASVVALDLAGTGSGLVHFPSNLSSSQPANWSSSGSVSGSVSGAVLPLGMWGFTRWSWASDQALRYGGPPWLAASDGAWVRLGSAPAPDALFDPVTDVGWSHAYSTQGARFSALALTDGSSVTVWPDEAPSGGPARDLSSSEAPAPPTFSASSPPFNNKAVVSFDGGAQRLVSGTFASPMAHASGFSVVAVLRYRSVPGSVTYAVGVSSAGSTAAPGSSSDHRWQLSFGAPHPSSLTIDAGAHVSRATAGSVDSLAVDEQSVFSGDAGSVDLDRVSLGNDARPGLPSSGFAGVDVAFVGVYPGDVTSSPGWESFKGWASTTFGVSLS